MNIRSQIRLGRQWVFLLIFLLLVTGCREENVATVLSKLQQQQQQLKTLQAEMTTIIKPLGGKGPEIHQTGKIYTQLPNKTRVEISTPFQQITITNGNKMQIQDPRTGFSRMEDLSQIEGKTVLPQGGGATNPLEALAQFDLHLVSQNAHQVVLEGTPKESSPPLDRITLKISKEHYLPIQITLWGKEQVLSDTTIEYAKISGIYVPIANHAEVRMPHGTMQMDIQFENVLVNQPLPQELFEIVE